MFSKIFKVILLVFALFYFGSGPVRILIYAMPDRDELNYSTGLAKMKRIHRSGEYLTLRNDSRVADFYCGYDFFGLDLAFCPLQIRSGKNVDGRNLTVGWYVQKSNFWGVTQKQIFTVYSGEEVVLSFDDSINYYDNKNSKILNTVFLLVLTAFFGLVARKVLSGKWWL